MILTNGRIHTMDAAASVVDTLVVRDGRIAFAGHRQDVGLTGQDGGEAPPEFTRCGS